MINIKNHRAERLENLRYLPNYYKDCQIWVHCLETSDHPFYTQVDGQIITILQSLLPWVISFSYWTRPANFSYESLPRVASQLSESDSHENFLSFGRFSDSPPSNTSQEFAKKITWTVAFTQSCLSECSQCIYFIIRQTHGFVRNRLLPRDLLHFLFHCYHDQNGDRNTWHLS